MAAIRRSMITASLSAVVVFLAARPVAAEKGMFLGTREQHMSFSNGRSAGAMDLLRELEDVMGEDRRASMERRVDRLEEAMRPMFKALPKDSQGRLSATGVRYMLSRLFVQRHGWYVRGLEPAGDSWNSSSPTEVIGKHVGEDVQGVFHERLHSEGFDLHEAAVLAATLESFVHGECVARLEKAFAALGLSQTGDLSEVDAIKAMQTYMMMYVLDLNYTTATLDHINYAFSLVDQVYPTWKDTVVFVEEVRKSVLASNEAAAASPTSWNTTLLILESVGERYGRWQDSECRSLKSSLLEIETPGTGRVPLEKFYSSALTNSSWQFMENVPYLRELGALDESDPLRLSVIIPNYLNGPNNCVASSKFYSVCCIDECDSLLAHLEAGLGAEEASPGDIARIVSTLPSDTVPAPRILSESLYRRLSEIAEHHGGKVQLHGRLFAQWMHHAYPRECSYPHVSGTTNPTLPLAFMNRTGGAPDVTHDEIKEIMRMANGQEPAIADDAVELPWTEEEELFVCRPDMPDTNSKKASWSMTWLLAMPISILFVVVRLDPKMTAQLTGSDYCAKQKYVV